MSDPIVEVAAEWLHNATCTRPDCSLLDFQECPGLARDREDAADLLSTLRPLMETANRRAADVAGHCPACGHSGLFVGEGGHVTCPNRPCPNPAAVDDLLDDRETEHIVTITAEDGWTIRHPLIERIGSALESCWLQALMLQMDEPPAGPGRYRVTRPLRYGVMFNPVEAPRPFSRKVDK